MPKVGKKLKVVNVSTDSAEPTPPQEVEEARKQEDGSSSCPNPRGFDQEIVEEVVAPVEPEVVKAKPRARAKSKAKVALEKVEEVKEEAPEEEAPEEEAPKEEAPEEVKEVKEEGRKSNNLVQCPLCEKWLTQNGLKYSHKCPAAKITPKVVERETPKGCQRETRLLKHT